MSTIEPTRGKDPGPSAAHPRRKKVIRTAPPPPKTTGASRAGSILKYAHESAAAMLSAFDEIRTVRRPSGGQTTDEEQDLLRAMLVFAAAGLDATLKRVIRDSLLTLIRTDSAARENMETFAARRIRNPVDDFATSIDSEFLAKLLASDSPRDAMVQAYVDWLCESSLQSPEQLVRAVKAFGLDPKQLGIKPKELRPVFRARNQIVHELDINFEHATRNRQVRKRDAMIEAANGVLGIADAILRAVDAKLLPISGPVHEDHS